MSRMGFAPKAGQNLVIEVDLEGGVRTYDTFGTGLENGKLGLRSSNHLIWQPKMTAIAQGVESDGLAIAPGAPDAPDITWSSTPTRVCGWVYMPAALIRNLILGRDGSGNFAVWREPSSGTYSLQTIAAGGGQTISLAEAKYPSVHAFWPSSQLNESPALSTHTPLAFFSHPAIDQIYYVDTGGTVNTNANSTWFIRSYTDTNADGDADHHMESGSLEPPDGASALIVHLDKLWMAKPQNAFGTDTTQGYRTLIYFTDAFNYRMIRATNFVLIEDEVRALGRPTSGGVGAQGDSQLVAGCRSSIWVIDGDPQLPGSGRRLLSPYVGVVAQSCMAESPLGLFVLCTDGQLYLLPPGAGRMIPIGGPIRNQFYGYRDDQVSAAFGVPTLLWMSPYLFYVTTLNKTFICDFSDTTKPKWWGFMGYATSVGGNGPHVVGGVTPFNSGSAVPTVGKMIWALQDVGSSTYRLANILMNSITLTGRDPALTTRNLYIPGYKLEALRAHLIVARTTPTQTYSVTATNEAGDSSAVTLTTQSGDPAEDRWVRLTKAFKPVLVGNNLKFTLGCPIGKQPYVRKFYIEVRVQPALWS